MNYCKYIASIAFCLFTMGRTHGLAATIFADDFDTYPAMVLPQGKPWPLPIPDSDYQYWTTGYYGTNAIVDAAAVGLGGRSGNVYNSSRGLSSDEANAFSKTYTASPYTNATWVLTFDLYIESITGKPATGVDVLNIFSTEGTGDFHTKNSIGKVFIYELEGVYKVGVAAGGPSGDISYTYFEKNVDIAKWYTVTITGNNTEKSLNFTLSDGVVNMEINNQQYLKNTHQFDGLVIGNTANAIPCSFYLDNIAITSEP